MKAALCKMIIVRSFVIKKKKRERNRRARQETTRSHLLYVTVQNNKNTIYSILIVIRMHYVCSRFFAVTRAILTILLSAHGTEHYSR